MTTAERLARYEDLFGLPDNIVGEIIAGQLYTHPRPAPAHVRASSVLGNKVGTPFDQGEGGGSGGWWILDEPDCTWTKTSLSRTSPAGAARGCPHSPKPRGSRWPPTGSAKCSPRPPHVPIASSNCPATPPLLSSTAGSSTPTPALWRPTPIRVVAGCCWVHGEAMTWPLSISSPPSHFPSRAYGWTELESN